MAIDCVCDRAANSQILQTRIAKVENQVVISGAGRLDDIEPAAAAQIWQQLGLDVVCITDHNVTSAAVAAAERDIGARVIIGEEVRTPAGDIIGLFLTERIPYVLPLAQVVSLIRGQGGLVYLPHPFDPGRSSLGEAAVRLCEAADADIIEAFNAKVEDQARNDRAAQLARHYGLPAGAGSDAHDPDGVGAAYLEMPDFDGPSSFLTSLRDAVITGEYRPHAIRYAPRPR